MSPELCECVPDRRHRYPRGRKRAPYFEPLCELGLENFRAAGIGGRDQAKCRDIVGVFLAFTNPHRFANRRREKLRQAVRNYWAWRPSVYPAAILPMLRWEAFARGA